MSEKTGFRQFMKLSLILLLIVVIGGGALAFSNYYANEPDNTVALDDNGKDRGKDIGKNKEDSDSENNSGVVLGPTNIADMVEQVSSAVVNIETSVKVSNSSDYIFNDPFFRQFFGDYWLQPRSNYSKGIGTGFIINDQGYILTNQHVIENAETITVNIDEDTKYSAEVIGQDYELDLAVLKISTTDKLKVLKMGDSERLRVGEWVIAIGNPYGLDHTVTAGVVSAKGRPIQIGDRTYKDLIQTDAAINPGNSGGPLLNTSGEVIGINTAVNSEAQGIGFAISINTAKEVINELIEKGKVTRPYIGVWVQTLDQELADSMGIPAQGLIIGTIVKGSPAEKAGLKKYDVITAIDGKMINTNDELQEVLKTKRVGDTIEVKIIRERKTITKSLVLAEKP
ncbi:MAG: S1C family serine protease [Syntrophomonadaceae bacterium]